MREPGAIIQADCCYICNRQRRGKRGGAKVKAMRCLVIFSRYRERYKRADVCRGQFMVEVFTANGRGD